MTRNQSDRKHFYAVIMAGGNGTRLWPLSRQEKPKQFQRFISSKTMIQETFARVAKVVPVENIYVSTTKNLCELALEQLPEITREKLIIEPKSRNTAPAIALVAASLARKDPEAIVATIASDHAIENTGDFITAIDTALHTVAAYREKLVTIGINPTRPDTSLGYIKMGKEFENVDGERVFVVDAFKEKPDQKTAEKYVAAWEYLWNAGYFIFAAQHFSEWTLKFSPPLHAAIESIVSDPTMDEKQVALHYEQAPAEPIDTLIVEKLSANDRLVIPSPLKWSDVGNWETLYEFLEEKFGSKLITRGHHLDLGSTDSIIYGEDRLVATIGIEDLVIVDTKDALLVAKRDRVSGEIKKLIEKLKKENKGYYL